MDEMSIADALRTAARNDKRRSRIGQLREALDAIEAAKTAGLSNKTIVAILNERGLQIDLNNFQIALHRLRKERKAQAEKSQIEEVPSSSEEKVEADKKPGLDFNINFTSPPAFKRTERS